MFLQYEGDVQAATEKQLKDWLTCENTLKIIGIIDEVKIRKICTILDQILAIFFLVLLFTVLTTVFLMSY